MTSVVVSSPQPGVREVALARPDRLNAMTVEMVKELHEALAEAEHDSRCRVVVLTGTGTGRGFCAVRPSSSRTGSR